VVENFGTVATWINPQTPRPMGTRREASGKVTSFRSPGASCSHATVPGHFQRKPSPLALLAPTALHIPHTQAGLIPASEQWPIQPPANIDSVPENWAENHRLWMEGVPGPKSRHGEGCPRLTELVAVRPEAFGQVGFTHQRDGPAAYMVNTTKRKTPQHRHRSAIAQGRIMRQAGVCLIPRPRVIASAYALGLPDLSPIGPYRKMRRRGNRRKNRPAKLKSTQ